MTVPMEEQPKNNDIAQDLEEEEETDYDSEEDDEIIRMKWIGDGSRTLDELIEKLEQEIEHVKHLKEQGYEFRYPMADDYGFLMKKKPEEPQDA